MTLPKDTFGWGIRIGTGSDGSSWAGRTESGIWGPDLGQLVLMGLSQ